MSASVANLKHLFSKRRKRSAEVVLQPKLYHESFEVVVDDSERAMTEALSAGGALSCMGNDERSNEGRLAPFLKV